MIATTAYIVACVGGKRGRRLPAQHLYDSPWFRMARQVAIARGDAWRILSAKHGLLRPTESIEPYDASMGDMTPEQRRQWGADVQSSIGDWLSWPGDGVRLVVLAGLNYRKPILTAGTLTRKRQLLHGQLPGITVEIPMQGMGIGYQLAWLSRQVRDIHGEDG